MLLIMQGSRAQVPTVVIPQAHLLLFKSIHDGNVSVVDSLLKKVKVPANVKYFDQVTALGYAAIKGNTSVIRLLLDHGAGINEVSNVGANVPPLGLAIISRNQEAIALLLQRGAAVKVKVPDYFSPNAHYNALIQAAIGNNSEAVRLLLQKGAAINDLSDGKEIPARGGKSALIIATENRYTELARLLVDNGASVNLFGKGWETTSSSPLIAAARGGDTLLVKWLLDKGANVNAVDGEGVSPLLAAGSRSNRDAAALLLDRGARINDVDKAGNNALLSSILFHTSSVSMDLSEMAAIRDQMLQYEGALMQVKWGWKKKDSVELVTSYDLQFIEADIKNAVYPEKKSWEGLGSIAVELMRKVEVDNLAFTKLAISKGIDIRRRNNFNQTAAKLLNDYKMYEALQLVVEADGIEPGIPAGFLLNLAIKRNSMGVLEMYLKDFDKQLTRAERYEALTRAIMSRNAGAINLLLRYGGDVNAAGTDRLTPLHYAAYTADTAIVSLLLSKAARKANRDSLDVQPYHVARFMERKELLGVLTPDSLTRPRELAVAHAVARIERRLLEMNDLLRAMQFDNNRQDYYLNSLNIVSPTNDPLLNWMQQDYASPHRDKYIQALLGQNYLVVNPAGNSLERFAQYQDYKFFRPFSFTTTARYKNGSNSSQLTTGNGPLHQNTSEQKESSHDAAASSAIQLVGMKTESVDTFQNTFVVWSGAFAVACGGWKNNCAISVGGKCIEWKKPEPRRATAGYTVKGTYSIPKVELIDGKYHAAYPGVRVHNLPKSVPLTIIQNGVERSVKESEFVELDRQLGDITVVIAWDDEVSASGGGCQDRVKESLFTISYPPVYDIYLEGSSALFEDRLRTYRKIYAIRQFQERSSDTLTPVENYTLLSSVHLLSEKARRAYKDVIKAELNGIVDFFANTNFQSFNDALIQLAEVQQIDKAEMLLKVDQALQAAGTDSVLVRQLTDLRAQVADLPISAIRQKLEAYKKNYMELLSRKIASYNTLLLEYSMYIPEEQLVDQLSLERIPLFSNILSTSAKERFRQ